MSRALPAVLLAPVLAATPWLSACGSAPGETVAVDTSMAELVPADAVLFATLPSLDALEAALGRVGSVTNDLDPDEVLAQLEALAGVGLDRLDRGRPLGMALSLDARTLAPSGVLLLPAEEPEELAEDLALSRGMDVTELAVRGGYLAVPEPGSAYAPGGVPHALAVATAGSDLDVRVDLARLVSAFRPMFDQGVADLEGMVDEAPPGMPFDVGGMLSGYLSMARAAMDSVELLHVSATIGAESWNARAVLTARAGSPMATLDLGEAGDVGAIAPYVDVDAGLVYFLRLDFEELADSMEGFLGAMFPGSGLFDDFREVYALYGGAAGGAIDFADGLSFTGIYATEDGEELLRKQVEVMTGGAMEEMGLVVSDAGTMEVDGLELRRLTVTLDHERLGASTDEAEEMRAAMAAGMALAFGEEELAYGFAAEDDRMLMLMGSGGSTPRAVRRFREGGARLPADLRRAVDELAEADAGFVSRIDVARFLLQVMTSTSSALGGPPPDVPAEARSASVPFTVLLAVTGAEWTATVSLVPDDLARIGDLLGGV